MTTDRARLLEAAPVAWLVLAAAFVVMGGQFAVGKLGLAAGLTPHDIVALRFAGAALVAVPVVLRRGPRDLAGVGWGRGVILALVAGSPYALLMYAALRLAPAAHGALLVPGTGLVVAIAGAALWDGERPGLRRVAGAGVVLAGLGVLTAGGGDAAVPAARGDALFVLAGASWGVFTILVRRWRLDALPATAAFSILSLAYLPVYALALEARVLDAPGSAVLLQAGYQGLLQTVFAFAGYAFAVRRLGAATASTASASIPVLGTLLAIPIAGEWPAAVTWVGLAVVCAGIVVTSTAAVGHGSATGGGRRRLCRCRRLLYRRPAP